MNGPYSEENLFCGGEENKFLVKHFVFFSKKIVCLLCVLTKKNQAIFLETKIGLGQIFFCSPIKLLWPQIQVEKPVFELAHISDTPFHQKSPVHWKEWFPGGENTQTHNTQTDITTYRLKRPRDRFSENKVQ